MNNTKCPFCFIDREVIASSDLCFSIYDNYPVNKGHVLVIPYRHVPDYFDLSEDEIDSIWKQVNEVKNILDRKFEPDGYNIGLNVRRAAGQTIDHVHIHVIPRYKGDMEDPTGGVRHVIPGKGKY